MSVVVAIDSGAMLGRGHHLCLRSGKQAQRVTLAAHEPWCVLEDSNLIVSDGILSDSNLG